MHGVGTAHAAITVVNALPTGIGSAAGVSLATTAEVELETAASFRLSVDTAHDTRLLRQAVAAAVEQWGGGRPYSVVLHLRSDIPPSKGLKSSSALPTAIARAVSSAMGQPLRPIVAAQFAATVGRASGLSATGAFDDALAGSAGGFVVTDNQRCAVLRHDLPPAGWKVVLWIPDGTHRPSSELVESFSSTADESEVALRYARNGEYPAAMNRNTQRVERVMGYEYAALHASLRQAGALASGVTGMGPAVAALVLREHAHEVREVFPSTLGETKTLDLLPIQGERLSVTA
ncbi:MAG: shikimate kinase [Thermoplasmata archaeon]|nr:shikimate kinase [Thermoplasmata archaeon]